MRAFWAVLIAIICFAGWVLPADAKSNPRYASIVMDADTGLILSQSHADKILHPASLTKMMTLMLTFEALENGTLKMSDRIHISRRAANMVPSKLGLKRGSSIRVRDAILALVTKSANDVAVALAEHLAGTESHFAVRMTKRARDIGMSRTVFRNASGLHSNRQMSTARDMAKLSRYLIKKYPKYYKYFSTRQFTYRGNTYRNHNRLMRSYKGMDGLKTGYIGASGFNLAASAMRGDRRLIGIVFGGRTGKSRNAHMAKLLNRGFDRLSKIRMASAQVPLPKHKPSKTAPAYASLAALHYSNQAKKQITKSSSTLSPETRLQVANALHSGYFGKLIGEGDYDPAASKRIETGLITIAVHKGEYYPDPAARPFENSLRDVGHAVIAKMNRIQPQAGEKQAANTPIKQAMPTPQPGWSIQVGAFKSRAKTDRVLRAAQNDLPAKFAKGSPMIAPLQTSKGMLFRARLSGYSKREAREACKILKECITIGPKV